MEQNIHCVTGAFGHSGKYIAEKLLEQGKKTITLTNSKNENNLFDGKIESFPLNFANKKELANNLKGVEILYNTYWVRFNHKTFTHKQAVQNTFALFDACKEAGVKKIVHISITNPDINSDLEYFRCKAQIEEYLKNTGISYSILRPAIIFGGEKEILINNIAWTIRYFPFFAIFGDGNYKIQPIYVRDLADLAVREGENKENLVIDAIGQETYKYKELVKTIGKIINKKRPIVRLPDEVVYLSSKIIGCIVKDKLLTRDEMKGLKQNKLFTNSTPVGKVKLSEWIKEHSKTLGVKYSNEIKRRK